MKEYEKFKVGEMHKCCGGDDCLILAISEKRVLVVIPVPRWNMVKLAVGYYPQEYDGELVWDHGHYYHADEKSPEEIMVAWNDWNGNH